VKYRKVHRWFRYIRRRWDAMTAKAIQADPDEVRALSHSGEFALPTFAADLAGAREPLWERITAPTLELVAERLILDTRVAHWITRVREAA
jgi:hypothetical protein